MSDPRDYKVDIAGLGKAGPSADQASGESRPFLGIQFNCCKIYHRIYRTADGRFYRGRCPRCGRAVEFKVGTGGSDSRFFVVD